MRKLSLLVAAALLAASPALADFTSKNKDGDTINFKSSGDCTSIVCLVPHYLIDSAGSAVGVAGSPLFMGFGTGVQLPAFAATPTFNLGTIGAASTAANQTTLNTAIANLNTAFGTQADGTWDGSSAATLMAINRYQGVKLEAVRALLAGTLTVGLPSNAATATNQATMNTNLGGVTETAPASDTASSGLNGRLQRIAQSITTLNGKIDTLNTNVQAAIGPGGSIIGQVDNVGKNVNFMVTPTVAASSHVAASSIGGLQTIAFFRASPTSPAPASSFSGIVNTIKWAWKTGSNLTAVTVYLFVANPTGSTCTDATAFSLAAADVPKLAAGSPFILTPAVIGSGASISAAISQSPISVQNLDGTPGQNLYACVVANATITPGANDGILTLSGLRD